MATKTTAAAVEDTIFADWPDYPAAGETQSRGIARLAAALAEAQSELPRLVKDADGRVGSQITHYASLEAVVDAMRGPFNSNGLAFTQSPVTAQAGFVGLKTRLLHSSGEWLEDVFELPAQATAQGYGSALTYARRYALQALAGLAPEDDDGTAATYAAEREPRPAMAPEPAPAKAKWSRAALRDTLADEGMKVSDLAPVIGPVTSETYAYVLDAWFDAHPTETVNTLVVLAAQERVTS